LAGGRKINAPISFSPRPIPGLPPGVPFARDLAPAQETKDQFLAEAEKLNLPLGDPVSGPDAEKIIASLYAAPPALVARTQAMVAQ
jgi:hypothetical protein